MPLPRALSTCSRPTRLRAPVGAATAVLALLLTAAAVLAEPGAVLTKDNRDYFGDVTANPPDGPVTISVKLSKDTPPQPIQIKRGNVQSVTLFKSNQEEYDYRAARAGKLAARHVETARWAMSKNEPEWAQRSLASAKSLQPNDPAVQALDKELSAKTVKPADPATQPVRPGTNPAAPVAANSKPAIRTLTPEEINVLRQMEWTTDEPLTVKIDPDLRKRYMDTLGVTPAEAKQKSPQVIAKEIIRSGTPDMRRDLKIVNDPLTLREWRANINNKIIGTNTGCAAAACHHPQSKAGDFVLFHGNDEAAGLTNFVIANQFYKEVQRPNERRPQQYLMIDRTQPQQSLLLHYALPVNMSQMPHPEVKGYNGVIRNRTDRNYSTLLGWLTQSLPALPPPYAEPKKGEMFDLSSDPKDKDEKKDAVPAGAAERPARAAEPPARPAEPPARGAQPPARIPPIGGGPNPKGLPGNRANPPQ